MKSITIASVACSGLLASILMLLGCPKSIVCTTPDCQGGLIDLTGAIKALDDGIVNITNSGDAWVATLDQISRDLVDRGLPTAAGYVRDVLETGIAKVGLEFSCRVDFTADRIRKGLSDLKQALLNLNKDASPAVAYPPTVCSTIPDGVRWIEATQSVIFSGYDLSTADTTAVVIAADGSSSDVTPFLTKQSQYQMTVNLSPSGAAFPRSCREIVLNWHGNPVSSIPCLTACPPAPPPIVVPGFSGQEEFFLQVEDSFLTGGKKESDFLFTCPPGSHRTELIVQRVSSKGRGNCGESGDGTYNDRRPGHTYWLTDEPNDCRFHGHAGIEAGLRNFQKCSYIVRYVKDPETRPRPAPTVGWCP